MLQQQYSPFMVLDVLPKLINHASLLMPSYQISEKELIGYCSYYHLLLYMCHHYPSIQEKIENQLQLFLQHNSHRGTSVHLCFLLIYSFLLVKNVVPNLGELLVYLSVSSTVTWRDMATVFLQGNSLITKERMLSYF